MLSFSPELRLIHKNVYPASFRCDLGAHLFSQHHLPPISSVQLLSSIFISQLFISVITQTSDSSSPLFTFLWRRLSLTSCPELHLNFTKKILNVFIWILTLRIFYWSCHILFQPLSNFQELAGKLLGWI